MNKAFPPVDDAISYLSKVDWNKHVQQMIMFATFVAAVVYVIYTKIAEWYTNGGKEQIVTVYDNFIFGCQLVYDWFTSDIIPDVKLAMNRVTDSLFYTATEVF